MYISNQLAGTSIADSDSIKPHLQQYVVKSEEAMDQLRDKIEELKATVEKQQSKIEVEFGGKGD